jgi:hypothetical protein
MTGQYITGLNALVSQSAHQMCQKGLSHDRNHGFWYGFGSIAEACTPAAGQNGCSGQHCGYKYLKTESSHHRCSLRNFAK